MCVNKILIFLHTYFSFFWLIMQWEKNLTHAFHSILELDLAITHSLYPSTRCLILLLPHTSLFASPPYLFPPFISHHNVARPSGSKQRAKHPSAPRKRDAPPCNLGPGKWRQTPAVCLARRAEAHGFHSLVCPCVFVCLCLALMAAKARREALLSFPFSRRWLLTP